MSASEWRKGLVVGLQKASSMALFAVLRKRGPAWNPSLPLEQQPQWREHAAFMDSLVDRGFVVLGGPLDDGRPLLIVDASDPQTIERTLADDPWFSSGLLLPSEIHAWQIRLGHAPTPSP